MKRERGFTLIELLVSVSIISVLISLTLPALSSARRLCLRTNCQTRLREVGQALWAYSVANDSCVPYVISPMTNGSTGRPGFGQANVPDADLNPFDMVKWPNSLQNLLLPLYLANAKQLFVCPAARLGWPRKGGPWQMTYRDAGANQSSGRIALPDSYERETFGFLDGRPMREHRYKSSDDPVRAAQGLSAMRGAYLRDMVVREGNQVIGPHEGGINLINREFGVEFRDRQTTMDDLALFGGGVKF